MIVVAIGLSSVIATLLAFSAEAVPAPGIATLGGAFDMAAWALDYRVLFRVERLAALGAFFIRVLHVIASSVVEPDGGMPMLVNPDVSWWQPP
jgi:hypothetical protein